MVAKVIQKTLSKTSLLANFLLIGNLLTFDSGGECTHVTTLMITVLLPLCVLSYFFFHFTDSFCVPDKRVYYGIVTPNGLAMFKPSIEVQVPKEERCRLVLSDFVLASHEKEMDEVMEGFPLRAIHRGDECSAKSFPYV
ncbi:hypothetical protein RHSIM_Rhsim03G0020900 [Rhododendron simsii]|uniref:Transmembrane protein n=1 Tax=Rhododendron simsii TaxID=118357 RepID=A0A834H8R8_RHOSS|nr:hypothetical protein RHSIM_Rhsim03G0020900 [Rhododendron simsii]